MMIAIVAHHYVVNSGIMEQFDFINITGNMIFLQFFGFAGKTMINGFILISGYFMVKHKTSLKKIVKLYFQIKFYKLVIYFGFLCAGVQIFSVKSLIKTLFSMIDGVGVGFTATFFLLYLLMPFINKLISNLTKKQFFILLVILFIYYTLIPTFYPNNTFNEIGWYINVYLIGAFIRLYLDDIKYSKKILITVTSVLLLLIFMSIVIIDFKLNTLVSPFHFVSNANKLLALAFSISLFLFFKNINIENNKIINAVSSTTFGVLLIHANSDAMRQFLWKDVLNVGEMYNNSLLVVHAIMSVIVIFVICSIIEYLRIKYLEKPFLSWLDKKEKYNQLCDKYNKILS